MDFLKQTQEEMSHSAVKIISPSVTPESTEVLGSASKNRLSKVSSSVI